VMGTVQSAQDVVEDSIQVARDTVATVKRTFDIRRHVEQHPWPMVGGSALAGLVLAPLLQRMFGAPRRAASPARPARQRGSGRVAAAPLPASQSLPPSRPGCLDLFHDEIAKVKGIAVSYVMGLVRDACKDSMPQLASQIDGVMNSITTKLGGEPAAAGEERGVRGEG
jgi:hypothetical protein